MPEKPSTIAVGRSEVVPRSADPHPTDAAFLRNLADMSSGRVSARLREIADKAERFDPCVVTYTLKGIPAAEQFTLTLPKPTECELHDWHRAFLCSECGMVEPS